MGTMEPTPWYGTFWPFERVYEAQHSAVQHSEYGMESRLHYGLIVVFWPIHMRTVIAYTSFSHLNDGGLAWHGMEQS